MDIYSLFHNTFNAYLKKRLHKRDRTEQYAKIMIIIRNHFHISDICVLVNEMKKLNISNLLNLHIPLPLVKALYQFTWLFKLNDWKKHFGNMNTCASYSFQLSPTSCNVFCLFL